MLVKVFTKLLHFVNGENIMDILANASQVL